MNVLKIHFNQDQKKEFSKAIFTFGNVIGGAVLVNQAVLGLLTIGAFLFGLLLVALTWGTAILLLSSPEERKIL